MKALPFTADMAGLVHRRMKTHTRRIIKPKTSAEGLHCHPEQLVRLSSEQLESLELQGFEILPEQDGLVRVVPPCRYGGVGNHCYIKEPYKLHSDFDGLPPSSVPPTTTPWYLADGEAPEGFGRYRHGRFMPREFSRLIVEITAVRAQRLQDISEEDAKAEGAECWPILEDDQPTGCWIEGFAQIWERINGEGSWDVNPWVRVVAFKPLPSPSDAGVGG